ncbi:ArsR/SmtB family transcription factor [Williamsia sp. SKLECPSW1]
MPPTPRSEVSRITSPATLKAISHPLRIRLLHALRAHGPMTVSGLGDLVDESPGSVSYHLGQLAKHGFVVEAENPTGDKRQHWWRSVDHGWEWFPEDFAGDPEAAQVAVSAKRAMLDHHWSRLVEFESTATTWGDDWSAAAFSADFALRLTPAEMRALFVEIDSVVARYRTKPDGTAPRDDDDDRKTAMVLLHGFPVVP